MVASVSKLQKTALILFAVGGVSHLFFGVVYFTADEFMSYHSQALSKDWDDLDIGHQTLLLALLKLAGAGGLTAAITNLTLVSYFFRRKLSTLIWALPVTSLIFQLAMNFAVFSVDTNTPGRPPLAAVSIGTVGFIFATCLLLMSYRRDNA